MTSTKALHTCQGLEGCYYVGGRSLKTGHPLPSGAVSGTWSLKPPSSTYHTLNLDRAVPSDPSSGRKEKAGERSDPSS